MSETIKHIIKNITNLDEIDNNGNTLLLCLVYLNKIEDIKDLLKYKPNIFHKNSNDFNALTLSEYLKFDNINIVLKNYINENNIIINNDSFLRKRSSSSNFLYDEINDNNSNSSLSSSVSSISEELQ